MKKLFSIIILFTVWTEMGLSQCNFFPSFSPDPRPQYNGFSSEAGCEVIKFTVTPWFDDQGQYPLVGDAMIYIQSTKLLTVVNLGKFTQQNYYHPQTGELLGVQFKYRFSLNQFDPFLPESFELRDDIGIPFCHVYYYYKCPNQANYTQNANLTYASSTGPVVNGSLNQLIMDGVLTNASNSCLSATRFTVNGNLDIDVPNYCGIGQGTYLGGAAHIRMTAGSTITVKSGSTFNLKDNYIIACDGQRWNSIIVEPFATLNVINTTFDNGHFEINALAGSRVTCQGSTFKDGAIGINAENGAIINSDNCDFVFTGAFKSFYPNEPPIVGNRTFAGIKANFAPVKVSNGSTFSNLLNGIWGDNSNIDDNGSTYSNFWDYGTNNYGSGSGAVFNGNGIHSISSVGNNLSVEGSTFNVGNTGIYTKGVNCTNIKLNTMPYVLTGMYFDQSPGRNFDIKSNTINATSRGMIFGWTGDVNSIIVNDQNSINLIGENSVGIDLFEVGGPNKFIHNNNISIGPGYIGINHINSRNTWMYNNSIFSNGAGSQKTFGISILGKENALTACNLLSSSMNCQNVGLFVSQSANNADLGNYATGWYYDYQFLGTSLGTFFASNRMGNANHGLILGYQDPGNTNSARIGPQVHLANRWTGTHTRGAYHYGNQQDRTFSLFTINTQDPNNPDLKPNNYNELVGIQWFLHNSNPVALNFSCMGIGSGNPNPFTRAFPRSDDYFIVNNDFDNNNDWGSRIWTDRRQLYRELLNQYEQGNGNSIPQIFNTFFNQYTNTTVGQFEWVDHDLSSLFQNQSINQIIINSNVESIVSLEEEINDLLIDIRDHPENIDIPATYLLIDNLTNQRNAINISKNNLASINITSILTGLNQILLTNNSIPVTEIYEQNQKSVNTIMLEKMIAGLWSFNESEKAQIESIAVQCPYIGGEGVYRARALAANYSVNRYNDEITCTNPLPIEKIDSRIKETKNEIVIFPNPVSDELTIMNNEQLITKIVIRSMEGKSLSSNEVKDGVNQINIHTEGFNSGVYLAEISLMDGSNEFKKFIKK
ncbi:MAG: T9SS type A sorting domain-containing protein [Saprospiraceae bacterium]|jgi:hypothetical protein|nr:T9SS type A sorting domain-containing protein [Saprospiraceae bacterium]